MNNELMTSIQNVCTSCGITANYLTCLKKFGHPPKQAKFEMSTFHEWTCDFCGNFRIVTQQRDFFNPDFSLIVEVAQILN